MKSYNTKYKSQNELEHFIYLKKLNTYQNILLQIFTGIIDEDFIVSLVENIKKLIPHIKIIGTTTDGEIINDKVTQNRTILSFSIFEKSTIDIFSQENYKDSYNTAVKLANQIQTKNAKAAIVFIDGLHTNGELFANGFKDTLPHLILSGGMAGDNTAFKQTLVFTHKKIYKNGVVCAVIGGKDLIVNTIKSFGWESIGREFIVTKAKGNRVYLIDQETPVELYTKYLGKELSDLLPNVGIEFPLIINRNGQDIARAVISKESDDSLIFAGNIQEGDRVRFGYGNIEKIVDNVHNVINKAIDKPIESIFIYSCMARKKLLGKGIISEIKPLSKISTVSGFFTYGEFYTQNKDKFLLNQTMTLLTISENKEIKHKKNHISPKPKLLKTSNTIKALSHLTHQIVLDYEELNRSLEAKVKEEVEKNREKDKQILHQSKLAQMGELMAMIAHQWRQPLSAISATSHDLALKNMLGKYDKEYFKEKLKTISDLSQHLSSTIDDFRSFYKEDKEKIETTYTQIVKSVLGIIETSIKNHNIKLYIELNSKRKISVYPNELKQVVLNLIKNAEDAILQNNISDPYIKIKSFDDTGYSYLQIIDNAGGISEDIIDKIFEPYFSTKKKKDGTGLGLYMSKTIIEEHCNGSLSVKNNNSGAIFNIKL